MKKAPAWGCGRMLLLGAILLAVLGWMGYQRLMLSLQGRAAMSRARILYTQISTYAVSYDGMFPVGITTSNEAFRELFRVGSLTHGSEGIFYQQGCAWHAGRKPDEIIGNETNGFADALGKNENHWAYTSGLNLKTSPEHTPLLMDGFSETVGEWSDDPKQKGGFWRGHYAMIVRVSGRMKFWSLDRDNRAVETIDGKKRDIIDLVKTVPEARLLNPDG